MIEALIAFLIVAIIVVLHRAGVMPTSGAVIFLILLAMGAVAVWSGDSIPRFYITEWVTTVEGFSGRIESMTDDGRYMVRIGDDLRAYTEQQLTGGI